jgi:hypothetical protein
MDAAFLQRPGAHRQRDVCPLGGEPLLYFALPRLRQTVSYSRLNVNPKQVQPETNLLSCLLWILRKRPKSLFDSPAASEQRLSQFKNFFLVDSGF